MTAITIFGGGIFGLATAWECARRGARVRLIERARIGAGASGGLVGALSPHVPGGWNEKKAFQLSSLIAAPAFWDGVRAASGTDPGYARLGRLQPLADAAAAALARTRGDEARTLWQGFAEWRIEAHAGDDWRGRSPTGLWVHDTLSARLHPRRAAAALAGAIRAKGGEIIEDGGHAPARAEAKGPVIWATGAAGLADLSAELGRPVGSPVKGQAALLECAAPGAPQIFADGLHIVPHADGTVAIGSTSEGTFDDPTATDGALEALIERARGICPRLAAAPVLERWAGLRPRAASRAPLLGSWPGRPGHFVANGGFKIGFGMAPGVAAMMADLVLDGHDRIPANMRLAG